jgi:hypothetical protein
MSRDALLAVGVTLFVLGIILRGIAREHGRTVARRQQHDLETKSLGETRETNPGSHLERHFGRYASAVMVLGLILALAGFFR